MQGLSNFGDPLWHALINAEGHAARALLADTQPPMTAGEVAESVARADSALAPACADFVAKIDNLLIASMSAVLAQDARNTDTQPKEETP
jgi:hypothetical protein